MSLTSRAETLSAVATLLGATLLSCGSPAPPTTPSVMTCAATPPFKTKAARILVASFKNDGDPAVSDIVSSAITRFDEELDPSGKRRVFEIARVTDVFASHEAARDCATKLEADVVLWGTLVANPQATVSAVITQNVKVESVQTGDGATIQIGNIDLGGKPFTLLPSVTLRRKELWLMTSSRMDVVSLADVTFDAIASDRSLFFLPFLAGAAAFERGDTERAAEMFELATRGKLNAGGVPEAYAKTYLAALSLGRGETSRAAELLGQTDTTLAQANAQLVWQNRMLFGLASEQLGRLTIASEAYATAFELEKKVAPRLHGIAPLALSWVELHRGNVETALHAASSSSLPALCDRVSVECLMAMGMHFRKHTMQAIAVSFGGHTEEAKKCQGMTEALMKRFTRVLQGHGNAVENLELERMLTKPVTADMPLDLYQVAMVQSQACSMVHFPHTMAAISGVEPDLIEDVPRVYEALANGRGTLGRILARLPPATARAIRLSWACSFSVVTSELGLAAEAEKLAKNATEELQPADPPLLKTEVSLVRALPALRWRKPGARSPNALREAEKLVRDALPVLVESMGAEAPVVQRWKKVLTTHKLEDPKPQGAPPAICQPIPEE